MLVRSPSVLVVLVTAAVAALSRSSGEPSRDRERLVRFLLEETNAARTAQGLPVLERSGALEAAAQAHADDMLARRYFSHRSPEGEALKDRMQRISPRAIVLDLRENIATSEGEDPSDLDLRARHIIGGWLDSEGHRRNLLNERSTHVAFGVAAGIRGGRFVEYAVQAFGIEAGTWDQAPDPVTRPPARWRARLSIPVEFFIDDVSRPDHRYPIPDPERRSTFSIGGVPLVVSKAGSSSIVEIPRLEPGPYKLLARRAGEQGYQEIRTLSVSP